jgi:hypothetical protein
LDIIKKIAEKKSNKEKIALEVMKSPDCIPQLFDGLNHKKGSVKLGCEKVLRLISEKHPELIYPYFDKFVQMLDSENTFLKWGAIITIANLATVDSKNKFERIFNKYYFPITDTVMVTAANIIGNSWKIALAKPKLTEKIVTEILKAEKAKYEYKGELSPECSNVVFGHAIDCLSQFYDKIENKKPVEDFVKKQLKNTRKPVAKKAEKFIRKYKIGL